MPMSDDWPTQRLGRHHPGHQEDDSPEYLSTGWTPASAPPSPPSSYGRGEQPTAVTVWNTGVHPMGPMPEQATPTLRLPEQEAFDDRTSTVWRHGPRQGAGRFRRRTGRLPRWTALVLLIAAVAGVILWQRDTPDLAVTQVTVSVRPAELPCDRTAAVVAVVTTNGAAGTIRYRWVRSDGTDSGSLRQNVRAGQEEVRLPMKWTFHGRGTHKARAVVDILTPTAHTASASFTYRCAP
ncbi:hypothetical protein [Streptomyces sp. NPDC004065]|uniref:hypothetical protein n=1 Tax=Streptomyces sp. NPDC004065 TaxID=3364689 RepID=UPI00384ADA8D